MVATKTRTAKKKNPAKKSPRPKKARLQSPPKPTVTPPDWVLISPDTAKQMILSSQGAPNMKHTEVSRNRPLSDRSVKKYRNSMMGGEWRPDNCEVIKVAPDGFIVDGQHRLHAIIEYGFPMWSLVAYGVPRDVFDTIDTGKQRTLADTLAIEGYKYPNHLASAIRLARALTSKTPLSDVHGRSTLHSCMMWVKRNRKIESSLRFVLDEQPGRRNAARAVAPTKAAAFHFATSRIDEQLANKTWGRMVSGEALTKNEPVYKLRERLISDAASPESIRHITIIRLLMKCWNCTIAEIPFQPKLLKADEELHSTLWTGKLENGK